MMAADSMHIVNHQTTGGIPALRGFRKQFLHTLHRIIDSENEVIYPETLEDFAVCTSSGNILEIVQVKDHKAPLTFSELNAFFQRAVQVIRNYPKVRIILASYGKLGPELNKYIGADETTLKKNKKFSSPDMLNVFQRLSYIPLKEENEDSSIKDYLSRFPMTIGDWQIAFDLLMQDLYRGVEKGKAYTRQILQEHLQRIGQYLVEREAHHREWGVTIIPLLEQKIEKREQLSEEFYEGIAASWMHISAKLDIVREQHLNTITNGFKKTNIVIIHGASGQGKSALAYRYLYDYCPSASRYEIRDLSTPKRALEVATALAGYGVPLTFYVDVSHKDKGFPEFLRRISELEHVNCIVTIREEDWRLTGLTSADIQFTDLELSFNREEAQDLYAVWDRDKGSYFPDFEQAWAQFAEEGPLLEFIHLLTHTESLRDRLQKQYERIADEIDCQQRPGNDLKLVEYVAVAGASGARIDLSKLSGNTTLKRSISRLEKEYLLRLSNDERHLIGLHPIRSKILASIITDPVIHPWATLAMECLPLLEDADLEVFLLYAFISHPEASEPLLEYLGKANYETWTAVSGVVRALQWMGINEYVQENKDLIKQVYEVVGDGWYFILDFDFLGLMESSSSPSGILDLLPEQGKKQAEQWRKHQTPKSQVFKRIDDWLQKITLPPVPLCEQERDWQEFGQVAYWIGFIRQEKRLYEYLDWTALRQAVESLSLESLGILIYGLWHALSSTEPFAQWYSEVRSQLLNRYRIETNTPYIEERDMVIRAHFIVPLEEDETKQSENLDDAEKNRFHFMALRHVGFLAQLFPDCNGYGCQGYGHQVFDFDRHDDTTKTKIAAWYLTPDWVTQINKTARILACHLFRPPTWKDYSTQIFRIRGNTVLLLNELRKGLVKHFRSKKPVQQLSRLSDTTQWKEYAQQIKKIPGLPLEALDSWGYTEEAIKSSPFKKQSGSKEEFIISVYLLRYQAYLQLKNDFFRGLNNFINQSPDLLVAHSFLGKAKTTDDRLKIEQTIRDLNLKIDRPFLPGYNLGEVLKTLSKFQFYFRKHFSGLLDKEELSQLEQKEFQTLRALWALWFFFVTQPSRHMDIPGKATLAQLDSRMQAIRKCLEKALKRASTEELRFCSLGDSMQFENGPALWITVAGENPLDVYSQTETLFMLIRDSLGDIKLHSLEHFALEIQWQHLVIVPICRGKLLEKHAWAIPVYQFISELNQNGGLSTINLVPRPIEQEVLNRLGLELWEPALLNDPIVFFQNAATLQVRLRHLVQIGDLPDLDETGTRMIQSYFDQLKEGLSGNLQQVIDKAEMLASQRDKATETYHGTSAFEYLQLATDQLNEIYDKLIPDGLKNGRVALSIETLRKWQEQVFSVQGEIFIIYLLWCGYMTSQYKLLS
jgi:hypothetical protein